MVAAISNLNKEMNLRLLGSQMNTKRMNSSMFVKIYKLILLRKSVFGDG